MVGYASNRSLEIGTLEHIVKPAGELASCERSENRGLGGVVAS